MPDSDSVATAMAFLEQLNAGQLPDLCGQRVEVEDAVVDGCEVVLFGLLRPAGSPVACRLRLEQDAVTDWTLYGTETPASRLGVAVPA